MQPLRQSTARTFPSHISTAASRIARIIVEPVGAPEALYNKDHGASQEYMTRIKKEKGLPMACPNCGQPTIEGAKFCASCGSPLTQTTAAAPQAPAAPESDDGTMLSSAPHMAPAPQMPTAAVPLPNSAHRQLRKPPSRSPPHRNRRRKHSRPLRRRQRKRWHHRPRRRSSSSMRHPRPRSRQQRRSQASRPSKSPVRRPIPPSPR